MKWKDSASGKAYAWPPRIASQLSVCGEKKESFAVVHYNMLNRDRVSTFKLGIRRFPHELAKSAFILTLFQGHGAFELLESGDSATRFLEVMQLEGGGDFGSTLVFNEHSVQATRNETVYGAAVSHFNNNTNGSLGQQVNMYATAGYCAGICQYLVSAR